MTAATAHIKPFRRNISISKANHPPCLGTDNHILLRSSCDMERANQRPGQQVKTRVMDPCPPWIPSCALEWIASLALPCATTVKHQLAGIDQHIWDDNWPPGDGRYKTMFIPSAIEAAFMCNLLACLIERTSSSKPRVDGSRTDEKRPYRDRFQGLSERIAPYKNPYQNNHKTLA